MISYRVTKARGEVGNSSGRALALYESMGSVPWVGDLVSRPNKLDGLPFTHLARNAPAFMPWMDSAMT